MKKIILTLTIFFCVTGAFAQLGFGFKAGVNLSSVKTEASAFGLSVSETSDSRLSYNVGAFAVIPFSEKIGLQPELLLSSEGGKNEADGIKKVEKYTFINVPILLRFTFGESFHAYVGPQVGLNIGAKFTAEGGGSNDEGDIEDVSGLGLSSALGVGYYVTEKIEINCRYNLGLSNWYDGEAKESVSQKINTIQIGLALKVK